MNKVGGNDQCPCGSGKKYKKCYIDKYPRSQFIYIGYREKSQGVTFENGRVRILNLSGEEVEPDAVLSRTEYKKRSGKVKVVSSIPNRASIDIASYLASNFDLIVAIDTNTKRINEEIISISCIYECYVKKIEKTQEIHVKYRSAGILNFKNCGNDAEKFAWAKLVEIITSGPNYKENLRIGLVTDHDLNNHSKYNASELPIYRDVYLPTNFTLLYATSDSTIDSLLNMLICKCDKESNKILKQLTEKGSVIIDSSTITIDKIPSLAFQ